MLLFWMIYQGMLTQDPHSFANMDAVHHTHISLDLKLDFERKVIDGRCVLTLNYSSDEVSHVDLDTRGLQIKAVTSDGAALPYTLGADKPLLGQRLRIDLAGGRPDTLTIDYATSPGAEAVQWLSAETTSSGRLPFLFTQSQTIYARTFMPCMDSPGVRVTYDAVVRVPKGMTAVMSAEMAPPKEPGVFRFKMPQPIPPYLIALAAGELVFKPISARTGVYAEPSVVDAAVDEFRDMERMMTVVEGMFGAYDWGRWDMLVLPPSFPFGGMENPRLTFATPTILAGDRSLVSLLAHELAHSWSGNLVTNAIWSDIWLNEGFTSYLEYRMMEALYGVDVAEMHIQLALEKLKRNMDGLMASNPADTRLKLDLRDRDPDEGMEDVAYDKGAAFLRILEQSFGRTHFDAFLKRYFKDHAFQSISTDAFLSYLRTHLFNGDQARWQALKVDEWVMGTGMPENHIKIKAKRFEATRAAAQQVMKGSDPAQLDTATWITQEWVHFLETLPSELPRKQLSQLDHVFKFSEVKNAEVLFAWLRICVRSRYQPSYSPLMHFLTRQGRLKFLAPLYRDMMAHEETKPLARKIYQRARKGYHPISQIAIDQIVAPGGP